MEGAVWTLGAPGAYACICAVEQGWRPLRRLPTLAQMVQVKMAARDHEPITMPITYNMTEHHRDHAM